MGHCYTPRTNFASNFCRHNTLKPDLNLISPVKTGKGGIPRILTLCIERLEDYYYRPDKILSLNIANGSQRQQRSERRESCIRLLKALLKRVDLTTLKVGIPTGQGFMNYTLDYIVKDTGMCLRRAERALRDLKAAGIVTVSQQRQKSPDGSWLGLAAIKAVSRHLFGAFGLARMLRKERDKASKRQRAQEKEGKTLTPTGKSRMALFLNAVANRKKPHVKQVRTADPPAQNHDRSVKLALIALEIKKKHMDWSSDKCFEEAEKQLSGQHSS